MGDDLAAANVNRSYQLAASSIAIFTFLLFFLYPRFASGQVDALPFQATLLVMGVVTFSFAFAVRLLAVAAVWFALWLVYVLFVIRYFPRVQTAGKR